MSIYTTLMYSVQLRIKCLSVCLMNKVKGDSHNNPDTVSTVNI